MNACDHIAALDAVTGAKRHECEACVQIGASWVHLRTCQTCGVTLCCDSSPNRHASTHARASAHPVVASAERGERWLYCFEHDVFAEILTPAAVRFPPTDDVRRVPHDGGDPCLMDTLNIARLPQADDGQ